MTRAFAAVAVVALGIGLSAGTARAAEGLYLSWNDCAQGPTATSNRAFACNTNDGEDLLYCAFTMPQGANNVIGIEIVLDVQHSGSPLPDWWRLDPGGCRASTNLTADTQFGGVAACIDMWAPAVSTAMVQGFIPSQPRGADSQARIKVTASVLPQDAVTVDGTSMYYAARVVLRHDMTAGSPACSGCTGAACLVLNSILIGRVPGSPGGDLLLTAPGAGDANWARWQGGSGADCAAVPVRARAWGQLKSQYR